MEMTQATTTTPADNQAPAGSVHQYAAAIPAGGAPPVQAPAPYYPQYVASVPARTTTTITSEALAAGMFGLIVVATGTMGANLHKVQNGDMTMSQAVNNSLAKGAAGGVAAASATAASATLTSGGITGLAVTLAAATGVGYLLSNG